MKKPNFFIIGAAKCATSSLASWLSEHPNIYMSSPKELHFFSSDIFFPGQRRSLEDYESLFFKATEQHAYVGEASVEYLRSDVAVPKILEYTSEAHPRFIVSVRNPVEMAVSLHGEMVRQGIESVTDFQTAWRLQAERHSGRSIPPLADITHVSYGPICKVGDQLEKLFQRVDKRQILVLVLDDIRQNPQREYSRILDFLELPNDGRTDFPAKNEAHKVPVWFARSARAVLYVKNSLGFRHGLGILKGLKKSMSQPGGKSSITEEVRSELQEYYRDDILKLSNLLGRDFSYWLK